MDVSVPGVLQGALHRGGDVGRAGRRAGPGVVERRRRETGRKPADGQRPLVLASPLGQLQAAQGQRRVKVNL